MLLRRITHHITIDRHVIIEVHDNGQSAKDSLHAINNKIQWHPLSRPAYNTLGIAIGTLKRHVNKEYHGYPNGQTFTIHPCKFTGQFIVIAN